MCSGPGVAGYLTAGSGSTVMPSVPPPVDNDIGDLGWIGQIKHQTNPDTDEPASLEWWHPRKRREDELKDGKEIEEKDKRFLNMLPPN